MKKGFLNTIFASWLKVFIVVVGGEIVANAMINKNLFTWDLTMWQQIISAGILGTIPIIINFFNPKDPRYGIKKTKIVKMEMKTK